MKRLFATSYLVFLLWLFPFPPWAVNSEVPTGNYNSAAISLGHHWRFSLPLFDRWKAGHLVPDQMAVIQYQLMAYEAALALILLGLLWVALPYAPRAKRGVASLFRSRSNHSATGQTSRLTVRS